MPICDSSGLTINKYKEFTWQAFWRKPSLSIPNSAQPVHPSLFFFFSFFSTMGFSFFFFFFFKFYFIFKLYNIVLVLPNIEMNPPQVYPRSPSWTHLPPPSPTLFLGRPSAPAPSIQYRASNLDWQLVSYMILYMFQCYSPKSSHPLPLPQSP